MNNKRKFTVDLPLEVTGIWSCTSDSCNGWMREEFALDPVPTCRLCQSPMVRTTRMAPVVSGVGVSGSVKDHTVGNGE